MDHRERWNCIFSFGETDRMPVYFFGTWPETKVKWAEAGYDCSCSLRSHAGPQIKGMDPDWESGMWSSHGLFRNYTMSDLYKVLEETDEYRIIRQSDGSIEKELVKSTSINHTLKFALEPTRESWENFKQLLDPKDKRRFPDNLDEKVLELKNKDMVRVFHGGSLYGWIRNWMGVENISYFMFDEPELLDEMVEYIVDFLIEVSGNALSRIEMDAAYIWEDCCGSTGPLFSPSIYKEIFDKHYVRLCSFYKSMGVRNIILDSDGYCDPLIPLWLKSGIDIIFPLEVGTWENSPDKVRNKFGRDVKIFGGINKHVIPLGKDKIREHLLELKPCILEGGIIPIPDHRIPPDCPLESVYEYIDVFNDVFNSEH
ncbi:MAG TPA: uroporphyrinogen decarboxylase family protein [Clostridia bacterium]|nr:uroporphyrinogen decarboxylase family protein [Clostridia bacterium]HRX42714.1 uroporphyrinogen decarboxylase family protein [Clostridia bacterium]